MKIWFKGVEYNTSIDLEAEKARKEKEAAEKYKNITGMLSGVIKNWNYVSSPWQNINGTISNNNWTPVPDDPFDVKAEWVDKNGVVHGNSK